MVDESQSRDVDDAAADDADDGLLLRGKSLEDSEMDITPMIDITFLLLIFFLVASKMEEGAVVPLAKASYGAAVPEKEAVVIIVQPSGGDVALVSDGHGNEYPADLEQQEQQVAQYVRDGLLGENAFAGDKKTRVIVKAADVTKHGEVGRILEAIASGARDSGEDLPRINIAVLEDG